MKKNGAYLQLSVSMLIVGSSVVVGKIIVSSLSIYLASCISLFLASVVQTPIVLLKYGVPEISKRDLGLLFFQALIGTFLYRILLLYGLRYTTAIESGIITGTGPAVTALLSFILLKESIDRNKTLGIVLTIIGVLLIQVFPLKSVDMPKEDLLIGGALVFLSVIAESLFSVFAKPVSSRSTPLIVSTSISIFGFILFLPLALVDIKNLDEESFSLENILGIIYYAVFVTIIAFLLWFKGLKQVQVSLAGIFTGFIPISATILSVLLLHEKFTIYHFSGTIFVIIGIMIIIKKNIFYLKKNE